MARILDMLRPGPGGRRVTVGPRHVVVRPSARLVEPPPRFAWDEKRWQHVTANGQDKFIGYYRFHDRMGNLWRRYAGQIIRNGSELAAYIHDPPPQIRRHSHGACLQLANDSWLRLHWKRQPSTVDAAILYFERMLDESFNGERRL